MLNVSQIQVFLAENVLPHLRSFLHDPDKVAAACANISSNIVSPAFRQKQRVPEQTLRVLREMTRIPSATKAWRLPIGEAFNDGRFFKQDTGDAEAWAPLVCALMDNDKDRFAELLGKHMNASKMGCHRLFFISTHHGRTICQHLCKPRTGDHHSIHEPPSIILRPICR